MKKQTRTLRACKCTGPIVAIIAKEWPAALDYVAELLDCEQGQDLVSAWRASCRGSRHLAALTLVMWSVGGATAFGEHGWQFSPKSVAIMRSIGRMPRRPHKLSANWMTAMRLCALGSAVIRYGQDRTPPRLVEKMERVARIEFASDVLRRGSASAA